VIVLDAGLTKERQLDQNNIFHSMPFGFVTCLIRNKVSTNL
jgi:hypothetical protein